MQSTTAQTFLTTLEQKYGVKFPELPKLLIWTIGLATAIGLTINDFVPLIKEYTDNNVAVQVKVVLLDEQFKPPQIVLAMPSKKIRNKFSDDLMLMAVSLHRNHGLCSNETYEICEELKKSPWYISSDLLQDFNYTSLETVYSNLTMAIVEKLLINIDQKIFPDEQHSLNGIFMSAMINYMDWITLMDYYLSDTRIESTIPFNLHPSPEFDQKFENYDKKLDLLANQTMQQLCTRFNYTELEYPDEFRDPVVGNKTCIDLLLNSDLPVLLIDSKLWVPLSAADGQKMKEYRIKTFPEKRPDLINPSGNIITAASVYGDPGILYQVVVDPIYSTYIFQTPVEKVKHGIRIIVRYKVQMRARETRSTKDPCLNVTSLTACFIQCTKLWIMEQCMCSPFSFRIGLAQPGMDYCTPNLYARCNITELPKQVTDPCMAKCQRPCGYTVYSWQMTFESFDPLEPDVREFILKLVPMLDSFTEFIWTVKDTPEQFLAQLAGIGSFYLGFSYLSLFAVVIWLMEWWKRYKNLTLESTERMSNVDISKSGPTVEGCRCDGRKGCHIDKECLMQIEAEFRIKWRADMEALIKEHM